MTVLEKLRIHIAPVGFEVDRIVLPAQKLKADRVWLLKNPVSTREKAQKYMKEIEKKLKGKIEIKYGEADRNDIFDTMKVVRTIFEEEEDNSIYVNVSSGSKIQAIACMMACMIFKKYGAEPYYAEPKSYPSATETQQSEGLKSLIDLPKYEIHKPKSNLIQALHIIEEKGGRLTKKELAELAEEKEIITVKAKEENHSQARFASLAKNIIDPLVNEWHFATVEKIGKNHWIKITEDGKNAASFLT